MGVGDHHGGELRRAERERLPVAHLQLFVALVEAAIDERPVAAPVEVGATAGDDAAGAVEGDGRHGSSWQRESSTGEIPSGRHDFCYILGDAPAGAAGGFL